MLGETLIGGAIIGKAQSAFAEILWSKVSDGVRAHLTLSKDKLKKAMEVALIYALERTVQQHLYFDSDLFLGNLFERPDIALVDRLLSRENYPSASELAEAWAKNLANTPDSERLRYAEAMTPQCATFLQEFRRALIHTRLLQTDPVMADLLALDAGATPAPSPVSSTQATPALEQQLAGWAENVTDAYQNLSTTLSQWMQRRWSSGLHQLPTDYTSELKNFLYEYLGGSGRTVPFGGRQSDLDFLTGWLDDPYMPQRLLIAAEAGRGKSALLTRWCAQLQLRGDTHVIFIPISLRFGTAAPEIYFSMLAARLAVILGETIQLAQLNAMQWKGECNSYLAQIPDDKRVLIILDGLDESIDQHVIDKSLIPRSLAKGVKVVVSARTQTDKNEAEWLRTLGWNIGNLGFSTTLLPLSETGVRDVLEAMGNPLDHLAERDVVIQELFRLTEGDPLLVGLYVDALAAKGGQVAYITLEELAQITPGLEGYFDQWWEDQHKQWEAKGANPLTRPEVEDFFYTLATARGPITKAELQQVLTGTTSPRLAHMAQEVKRFIVGDGVGSGYAFSHPRLGYYFLDQLSETDKEEKHQKYVVYGAKVLLALKTTSASTIAQKHSYILQHYLQHLANTSAPVDDYYDLLCHEWAESWFALRGTYDGFLADVSRIWEQAREDTRTGNRVRGMSQEILCALCQSSIVAISSNINPKLLAVAVEAGIYTPTQAFAYIRQMATDHQKVESIQTLVLGGNLNLALLREILEFCRSIQGDSFRADALRIIAPLLPLDQGLEVASSIQNDSYRAAAIITIAEQHEGETRRLLLQEALEVARSIQNDSARAAAISTIAGQHEGETRRVLLQEALEVARSIQVDFFRADAISTIAGQHEGETRRLLLQEALEVARSIQNDSYRAAALRTIAPLLPLVQALEVARSIQVDFFRADAISTIAKQHEGETRRVLLQEALEVARSIQDDSARADALRTIAPLLPLVQALEVARSIQDDSYRAAAISTIAGQHEGETRRVLLQEALEVARSIRVDSARADALRTIAPLLPLDQALEVARSIQDDSYRASALHTIAELNYKLAFSSLSYSDIRREWQVTIQYSATFSRPSFLNDLTALSPLTFFLANHAIPSVLAEEATDPFNANTNPSTQLATEIAKSIQDVCSWWP